MLTGRTTKLSFVILAAAVAAATQAQAHSSCTPQHLLSVLKQVESQCGSAKVVSDYRRGATIRGTRRASQHSFCNGNNGAIDAVFANRACALSALRKTNYTILTYGSSRHIHIGTDSWGAGGALAANRSSTKRVRSARQRTTVRTAYKKRTSVRAAAKAPSGVRVAHQRTNTPQQASPANWSSEY
jgi:hypothetical protein